MVILQTILQMIPKHIAAAIAQTSVLPEEIRLRRGQAPVLRTARKETMCENVFVTSNDLAYLIANATNGAYHSVQAFMEQGYIPLPGGCRMGISGMGDGGSIRSIRNISSVCIRIARSVAGCADTVLPYINAPDFRNTIIISPPGLGKTTLLREIIRKLSEERYYVAVADERGEIAGMMDSKPSFALGPRCDVITGISKDQAALMMLRSMSPDVLAMDEITAYSDTKVITEAVGGGVALLSTVHGNDVSVLRMPRFRDIYDMYAFEKAITISLENGIRKYKVEDIYAESCGNTADFIECS